MMKKITGSGCMLSSVIGAFAAANPNNLFYAVSVAFGLYASCGRNAYKENIGIATYKNNFFDEMTNPDLEGLKLNIDKKTLRLYAVTDRTWLDGRTLYDDVEKSLKRRCYTASATRKKYVNRRFYKFCKRNKIIVRKI